MRRWREGLSTFLWQLRNARYQQRRAMDTEKDQRSADYLERTRDGAGDRPSHPM
jgi:hypothetical protein